MDNIKHLSFWRENFIGFTDFALVQFYVLHSVRSQNSSQKFDVSRYNEPLRHSVVVFYHSQVGDVFFVL